MKIITIDGDNLAVLIARYYGDLSQIGEVLDTNEQTGLSEMLVDGAWVLPAGVEVVLPEKKQTLVRRVRTWE